MQRLLLTMFFYKIFQSCRIFTNDIFPEFIVNIRRSEKDLTQFNDSNFYPNITEFEGNLILQHILIQ